MSNAQNNMHKLMPEDMLTTMLENMQAKRKLGKNVMHASRSAVLEEIPLHGMMQVGSLRSTLQLGSLRSEFHQ